MEYKFTTEEQNIRSTVRKFVKNEFIPVYREIEDKGEFPDGLEKKFKELAILSLAFPEEYGGSGSTFTSLIIAIEELGYSCFLPASMILENFITAFPIYRFGSDYLKDNYLKDYVLLNKIGGMAFTEPNTGSDPKQLVTIAKKTGSGWILNGTKRFITNSESCDHMVLYARTEDGGVAAFLVDSKKPGYTVGKRESIMHVAMDNGDLYLEDYEISDDYLIGNINQGFEILLQTEAMGKLGFSAIFTGTARRALDLAIEYATNRMHRDKPIGVKFHYIQEKIARMAMYIEAMRSYLYTVSAKIDAQEDAFWNSAALKLLVAEGIKQIVSDTMEIHGAYSLSNEYDISRINNMAAFAPVVMGSMDIQRTIVARTLLGKGKYSD